ncbi:MAG: TSUP family transporter [Brevinema sp.]
MRLIIRLHFFLVLGSVIGGFGGHLLLNSISSHLKLIQTVSLLVLNIMVLFYTLIKHKICTYKYDNILFITLLGLGLGTLSAFLGIGGGPVNIALLHYFFSFNIKIARINSLFIILLIQISSLTSAIVLQTVPNFDIKLLICMSFTGIIGAIIGQKISSKLTDRHANYSFIILNALLVLLNIYTIIINLI